MVGLGTGGVYLAAHLLCHKAQLLATDHLVGHRGAEVVDVFLQAHLLLGDIELLEVVNQLLLEAVLVYILHGGIGHVAAYTLLGGLYALGLVGRYLAQHLLDEVHMAMEVTLQDIALVGTEAVHIVDGTLDVATQHLPVAIAQLGIGSGVPYVAGRSKHAQQVVGGGAHLRRHTA